MIHTRGDTLQKLGNNDQHMLKIWTLRDLKTSEKGGLKDLKRVFGKFEIGGLKASSTQIVKRGS